MQQHHKNTVTQTRCAQHLKQLFHLLMKLTFSFIHLNYNTEFHSSETNQITRTTITTVLTDKQSYFSG